MNITNLALNYSVAPQLDIADIEALKAAGYDMVINNRPDGETEDQPTSEQVRAAVEAAGLKYVYNPVDLKALSHKEVEIQSAQISTDQKVFAFCRTGTRSSVLWVLANQEDEQTFNELVASVQQKGFDLGRCMPAMEPLKK
ncbi:TIGR01244 family phosphatase [Marinomonas piezotolerans]|uniref:TIGR01244 family phosphatase n=1 Tax=Marinomonas piezotolerans TaxID=2213058 RepID=A0A370U592_9GAMM|nr:TIGR01244 family sulfur transferase [Marinomonas piezotolerans]RDL42954.1 TIGR01244 family phosphatase [Marinomonas piezotolerans]